jgi:hypothetical protein
MDLEFAGTERWNKWLPEIQRDEISGRRTETARTEHGRARGMYRATCLTCSTPAGRKGHIRGSGCLHRKLAGVPAPEVPFLVKGGSFLPPAQPFPSHSSSSPTSLEMGSNTMLTLIILVTLITLAFILLIILTNNPSKPKIPANPKNSSSPSKPINPNNVITLISLKS